MASRKRYQDKPSDRAQSQAWRIEAKNIARFQRAFLDAVRSMYDGEAIAEIARIINRSKSIDAAMQAVEALFPVERFAARMESAYVKVMTETGQAALREAGIDIKFQVVAKQVEGIPVNRFSAKWINERTGELIRQVSAAEVKRVRQIMTRNFGKRVNRRFVQDEIAATVGLLAAEEARANAVFQGAVAEGVPVAAARVQSGRIAERLLRARGERIARTETNMSQNEGKLGSWRVAGDEGLMPPGTLKTWIAASDSERTCEICGTPPDAPDGLDRQQVPVNEPFMSEIVGPLDRPPAHPN